MLRLENLFGWKAIFLNRSCNFFSPFFFNFPRFPPFLLPSSHTSPTAGSGASLLHEGVPRGGGGDGRHPHGHSVDPRHPHTTESLLISAPQAVVLYSTLFGECRGLIAFLKSKFAAYWELNLTIVHFCFLCFRNTEFCRPHTILFLISLSPR